MVVALTRYLLLAIVFWSASAAAQAPISSKTADLIPWLLKYGDTLQDIPFAGVIFAVSGKRVLAVDREKDAQVLQKIGVSLDAVLALMNGENSPVKNVGRINEASHFFEDALRDQLNNQPGWKSTFPQTTAGHEQRSGYPDLQLLLEDGRYVYLDPKLFAASSRDSTFRTFYFEPQTSTNKVNHDAIHLIVGIEHDFAATGRFLRWELIDLADFKVTLKAEFQGSNQDLYREAAVVGRGEAK